MQTGTIKFFNETKGFGFITNSEDKKDHFVHITGIITDGYIPQQDDVVSYEIADWKKGPQAVNVSFVESAGASMAA